jgi:UDP-N-acetylglucosamine 4,6-dehydratase/5-epimerase
VQKAPASTVGDLAQSRCGNCWAGQPIKVIGTRHGEKLYESLVSREEMARAEDLGGYYRIPADSRDLNYDKYFVEGELEISQVRGLHVAQHASASTWPRSRMSDEARHACARRSCLRS